MAQKTSKQTAGQAARYARKRELQTRNQRELTPAARRAGTLAIIQLGRQSVAVSMQAAAAAAREAERQRRLEEQADAARQAAEAAVVADSVSVRAT